MIMKSKVWMIRAPCACIRYACKQNAPRDIKIAIAALLNSRILASGIISMSVQMQKGSGSFLVTGSQSLVPLLLICLLGPVVRYAVAGLKSRAAKNAG